MTEKALFPRMVLSKLPHPWKWLDALETIGKAIDSVVKRFRTK